MSMIMVSQQEYTILSRIIKHYFNLENIPINCIKKEKSKKYSVYSIEENATNIDIVIKIFMKSLTSAEIGFKNEIDIYLEMKSKNFTFKEYLSIPELISYGENETLYYLIFKKTHGINVMDYIYEKIFDNTITIKFWIDFFQLFIEWAIQFYKTFKKLSNDFQPRNFIIQGSNNEISNLIGFDFETLITKQTFYNSMIHAFSYFYFIILGAYPGIFQGKFIEYKTNMGIILINLLERTLKVEIEMDTTKIKDDFIHNLEIQGLQRIKFREKKGLYSKDNIKSARKYLENIIFNLHRKRYIS